MSANAYRKPILASAPACVSYESSGDSRLAPSCREKHNDDCEREPSARTHNSVLHPHGMIAPDEAEENPLIGVSISG
jgi:hypothetical protein